MFSRAHVIIFISMAVTVGLSSCRTSRPKNIVTDGESVEAIPLETQDLSSVPQSMWPPEERQAQAGYYFLIGEMMALEGKVDSAIDVFDSAYNLDPNSFLGQKLVAAKLGSGKVEELLSEARKMVLLYPKSASLRALYGQVLVKKSLFKEATKEFEQALKYDSKNEQIYFQLVSLYQGMGHKKKSLWFARQLTKKIPTSLLGWSLYSRLLLVAGKHQQALIPARRAYRMQSNNPELTLVYAYVLELNKKTKLAVKMYEQLFRLNPTNQELVSRMISLYRETGGLKEALKLLNEMVTSPGGNSPAVQLHRAYLLWELKAFEEAATILIELAAQSPTDDRLNYLAALGYEKIRQFDDAMRMYGKIKLKSPFRKHAEFRVILVLRQQKKYAKALEASNKFIAERTPDWEAFAINASIYSNLKRYEDAVRSLNLGIEKFPKISRLYFLRGVNEEKSGDIDRCIVSMNIVIKMDPMNSTAYNYLGYLYAENMENLDEAETLIRKALELKPNDGYYLDSLGWVFFQKKEYKKALEYLQQALIHVPGEGVVLEHLGDVNLALGKDDLALDFYRQSSRGKSDDRDSQRVKRKLEELESRISRKRTRTAESAPTSGTESSPKR